jgi:sec-independent protein translocase protein TatA
MGGLQPWHWLIVVLIAVLLFGGKKLPDAARGIGRSMRILKAELRQDDNASQAEHHTDAPPAPQYPAPQPPAAQLPPAPVDQQHTVTQQPADQRHVPPVSR